MKMFCVLTAALVLLAPASLYAYDEPWQAIKADDLPAAERLVRVRLQEDPGLLDSRFLLARLLAWQGRYDEALREYDVLLAAQPQHADYLLGKGQTLFWQGRFTAALATVDQALAVRPDYSELWLIKIKILLAQGQNDQARRLAAETERRFGASSLAAIRRQLEQPPAAGRHFTPRREVESGLRYEYLSDDYDHWSSFYVLGEWFYKPRATLYAQGRFTDRFAESDQELTLGTYQPLGAVCSYQLEASVSPSHEVLAEYSVLAGLGRSLGKDWHIAANARHSIYPDTYSNLLSLTTSTYFNNQRLAYSLYVSKVEDASETYSHRLQWSYYYGRRNSIGLYIASGKETENIGEVAGRSRFLTTSVFGYGIVGRHWLADGPWAITYQLWQHDQGNIYTRWGGALGFRYQF